MTEEVALADRDDGWSRREVLDLREVDAAQAALVGGKGAHLAALARLDGIRVPAGFCVTTMAFQRVVSAAPWIGDQLEALIGLDPDDQQMIRTRSADLRARIDVMELPDDLAAAITGALARLGEHAAYAVRSSATAEDLPTASFAGQQDTYLNVIGADAILRHVSRCWASLFTERAVTYRLRNGVDHRTVHMAVVVQQMVVPQAAGILFTADPVTSNRRIAAVDAGFGLGEALVSGLVNPDVYQVRDGEILARTIATKDRAITALPSGGTQVVAIEPERQDQPALTDAQVLRLVGLGRRIEAHFGRPQDIEWCLADDEFVIVQSRPITTLFPVPAVDDDQPHVYISVGHQQMMTDPMRPLGLSVWQLTTPRPMAEAGGRLFVDVAAILASPATRDGFVEGMGRSDPLIGDALRTVVERGFIPLLPDDGAGSLPPGGAPPGTARPGAAGDAIETDPAIVAELIERTEASIATARRDIRTRRGPALIDFVVDDIQELRRVQFEPRSLQAILAGMEAARWLNDTLLDWLGERNVADTLAQSTPGNVSAEMGLALLDVADAIRPHPEVVAFLDGVHDEDFLDDLPRFAGGREAKGAIDAFLDRYGVRCVGEIDITRPRWRERPRTLLPLILGNVRNVEPGAGQRRFELGRQEALRKEQEVLERVRALPDGTAKADQVKAMIDRLRTFSGYREFPKFGMVSRYFVYRMAFLEEAERLAEDGVIGDPEDIDFLRIDELRDVLRTQQADLGLIARRRDEFASYQALTPPRVSTSEGEVITGAYRRKDVPAGALVGLPVSAGTVEGRARVILDLAEAKVEAGDILVTAYTDPSWSALFVAIAGVVTEVGGLMTHGAVIAREYGLPAVVGVVDATRTIRDGQRIRVHGTEGYVEILP